VITVLPLVWVMVTGAMLNHTVDWKLDQIQLTHHWVLRAYGMTPTGDPAGLVVGHHQIVEWDGQVFVDASPLEIAGNLLGAVADGNGLAVITSDAAVRLDGSGAIVESLGSVSLPELPLTGVASDEGKVFVENRDGWHQVGEDWLEFTKSEAAPVAKQTLSAVADEASRSRLQHAWTRGGLPASRVILDLHAGRFLGFFGKYFYDFVIICTLCLCLSGLVLFLRKPGRSS
jgi:hypothetical protein